jgi:hypothetical protein
MMLVPEVEAVDGELCRDRPRRDAMHFDLVACCKQIGDVKINLFSVPVAARLSSDVVEPQRCGCLNPDGHLAIPGSGRSLRRPSTGDNLSPVPRRRV